MNRNILITFFLLNGLSFFAQQKDVHSFIPKNYEILNEGIAKEPKNINRIFGRLFFAKKIANLKNI